VRAPPARILNREDHPPTVEVKRRAAIIGRFDQPRLNQIGQCVPTLGQTVAQPRAAVGRKAQPKARPIPLPQTALGQIIARPRAFRTAQRLCISRTGRRQRVIQALEEIVFGLCIWIALWQGYRQVSGQALDGFGEGDIVDGDDKIERIAVHSATKAMIFACGFSGMKTWRFLGVERATGPHVAARGNGFALVPHHPAPHHLQDGGAAQHFINKGSVIAWHGAFVPNQVAPSKGGHGALPKFCPQMERKIMVNPMHKLSSG
jgi:hypothetical protein